MTVVVKIQENNGVEVGSFTAENEQGLAEMAAMHGIEILVSCSTGFCGVCLCDVEWETQVLNPDRTGASTFEIPLDENKNPKQILACVGGVKPEFFTDWVEHEVILKKLY